MAGEGPPVPLIIGAVLLLLAVAYYFIKSKGPSAPGAMSSGPAPVDSTGSGGASGGQSGVVSMPPIAATNTAASYVGPTTGSDYPGNDLGNFSNADPNFCADKCNNTSGCIGFIVDSSGQGCYLKGKFANPGTSTTRNVYVKPGTVLPDAAAKYQPPVTGHYLGNDLASFANIDPNFCAAKCNSVQGCVGFEVDSANCVAKSQLTNPIDSTQSQTKVYMKPGVTSLDPDAVTKRQAIQVSVLEIGTASKTFQTAPSGYAGQTAATFSMTMDLYIQSDAPHWRNIFNHGPTSGNDCCGGPTMRKPAMYITGQDAAPANRIHIVMAQAGQNDNTNIVTQAAIPSKTWTKVTFVVSGGRLTTYINGVADPAGTVTGNFVWPTPEQPWTWLTPQYQGNAYGSIQVRNVYFWPFGLTQANIASLDAVVQGGALPDQALPAPPLKVIGMAHQFGQVGSVNSPPSLWYASWGRTNSTVRVRGTNFAMDVQNSTYYNPDIYVQLEKPYDGTLLLESAPIGQSIWSLVAKADAKGQNFVVFNGAPI